MALSYNAHDYINSSTFWAQLEPLRELLQPIDEALRMSESNQAHLEKVLDRWAKINTHLIRMKNNFPVLGEFLQQNGTFSTRYHRQVLSIHIVAFFLSPEHRTTPIWKPTARLESMISSMNIPVATTAKLYVPNSSAFAINSVHSKLSEYVRSIQTNHESSG